MSTVDRFATIIIFQSCLSCDERNREKRNVTNVDEIARFIFKSPGCHANDKLPMYHDFAKLLPLSSKSPKGQSDKKVYRRE